MPRFSFSRRFSPLSTAVACVAAGALTACSLWSGPAAPPQVAYDCDDGSSLVVQFAPDTALVKTQIGETFRLAQQPAASGIWYAADGNTLRGKGEQATWSTPGGAEKTCRSLPSKRSWWPW